jgi:uncharacterized delta-60 repeat protein
MLWDGSTWAIAARVPGTAAAVTLAALLLASQQVALAAPGDLDPTFDDDGRVVTLFERPAAQAFASDVVVQTDGRIVAAGGAFLDGFAIARYEADGDRDRTFGGDGRVRTAWPVLGQGSASAVALQPDGRIIAAGTMFSDDYATGRFAVARYRTDGSLDPSFGGDGRVSTRFAPPRSSISDIALQADGRIVVAGTTGDASSTTGRFALARYDTNGRLDRTFGGDGKVVTGFGTPYSAASGVAIGADGAIVAAGTVRNRAGSNERIAVARYLGTGALDASFGREGRATTAFRSRSVNGSALALVGGRVVVAGTATTEDPRTSRFALVRYARSGRLDGTFGGNGRVTTRFGYATAADVAVAPDGRIVAVGSACCGKESTSRFALAGYAPDGSRDVTFGRDGKVKTAFRFGSAEGSGVAIQADGRIVVCGFASFGHGILFALARYRAA